MNQKSSALKILIPAFVLVGIIVLMSAICSEPPLPAYMDDGIDIGNTFTSDPTDAPITSKPYQNAEYGYSLEVPEGWTQIIKDGYVTFAHRSGAFVQICPASISPQAIVMDGALLQEIIGPSAQIEAFTRYPTGYYSEYASDGILHIEHVQYGINTMLCLSSEIESDVLDIVSCDVRYMYTTFYWDVPDPVPENFELVYFTYGNFAYCLPTDWQHGSTETSIYGQSPQNDALYTLTLTPSSATYEGVSQLDYISFFGNKQDFMMQSFSSGERNVYAEFTYSSGGVTIKGYHYIISAGGFEFSLIFESDIHTVNNHTETFGTILDSFQCF